MFAAASGNELIDFLTTTGATGVLALVVVGFLRGWIVARGAYDREVRRADRMEELAFKAVHTAEQVVK